MRIFGQARSRVQYNSATTRGTSLDRFVGEAQGDQGYGMGGLKLCAIRDCPENLEKKFNSGANRTDIPSAFGPPSVDKKLGPVRFSLADEVFSWMRNKGESLFRKD